jgi:hypothetical protein
MKNLNELYSIIANDEYLSQLPISIKKQYIDLKFIEKKLNYLIKEILFISPLTKNLATMDLELN